MMTSLFRLLSFSAPRAAGGLCRNDGGPCEMLLFDSWKFAAETGV